ncbi:MAG: endonuclease/exonuclease/phosphatase family protein [Pseudomonadota bacterium]
MDILCLNAWGGKLHDDLLPYLAGVDADVLCLQEVIDSPATDALALTYRDGNHVLPQRANLFSELCAVLPGHRGTFCPAATGQLWDGDSPVPSRWGVATFVRAELPVVAQAQGFVHKEYGAHGYGDHPRSRSAHAVRVYDHARDRAVAIAQMHGLRDLRGKIDTPDRARQAARLLDLAQQVALPGDVTVLCGDFNVEPDSETLSILGRAGFVDLVTAGGHPGTRSSHYRKPGLFADYMMVNDPAAVLQFDVIRAPEVSDHCPLALRL